MLKINFRPLYNSYNFSRQAVSKTKNILNLSKTNFQSGTTNQKQLNVDAVPLSKADEIRQRFGLGVLVIWQYL